MASACRVDLTVDIAVEPDGSGVVVVDVVFDAEVLSYVPDLDQILRLDDVRATGWAIEQSRIDGGLAVKLSKPFASFDQLDPILDELTGADGLFGGSSLDTNRTGAITEYRFELAVQLDRPAESFIDSAVADVLDGELFGTPRDVLEQRAGADLNDVVSLVVTASLPGGEGRFPENGATSLASGRTESLVIVTEVMNAEIAAADAAARDARQAVSDGVAMTALIWAIVLVLGLVLVAVLVLTGRRRRQQWTVI